MTALVHFAAAGTTRPACGADAAGASTTATLGLVTCGPCREATSKLQQPTPHGRTN